MCFSPSRSASMRWQQVWCIFYFFLVSFFRKRFLQTAHASSDPCFTVHTFSVCAIYGLHTCASNVAQAYVRFTIFKICIKAVQYIRKPYLDGQLSSAGFILERMVLKFLCICTEQVLVELFEYMYRTCRAHLYMLDLTVK